MRDRHKTNTNTIHLFTKRDTNTLHLSLEGANHHSKINLYPRGITQVRRVTTLGGLSQPQTNFPTKIKILIDRIE